MKDHRVKLCLRVCFMAFSAVVCKPDNIVPIRTGGGVWSVLVHARGSSISCVSGTEYEAMLSTYSAKGRWTRGIPVQAVETSVSAGGGIVPFVSAEGELSLYDARTGGISAFDPALPPKLDVTSLGFADGHAIVTGSRPDHTPWIGIARKGGPWRGLDFVPRYFEVFSAKVGGKNLAVSDGSRAFVFEIASGRNIATITESHSLFAISEDGRYVAVVFGNKPRVFDIHKHSQIRVEATVEKGVIDEIGFCGGNLLAAHRNATLSAWEVASGRLLWSRGVPYLATALTCVGEGVLVLGHMPAGISRYRLTGAGMENLPFK